MAAQCSIYRAGNWKNLWNKQRNSAKVAKQVFQECFKEKKTKESEDKTLLVRGFKTFWGTVSFNAVYHFVWDFQCITKQLLNSVFRDIQNYQGIGKRYHEKPHPLIFYHWFAAIRVFITYWFIRQPIPHSRQPWPSGPAAFSPPVVPILPATLVFIANWGSRRFFCCCFRCWLYWSESRGQSFLWLCMAIYGFVYSHISL